MRESSGSHIRDHKSHKNQLNRADQSRTGRSDISRTDRSHAVRSGDSSADRSHAVRSGNSGADRSQGNRSRNNGKRNKEQEFSGSSFRGDSFYEDGNYIKEDYYENSERYWSNSSYREDRPDATEENRTSIPRVNPLEERELYIPDGSKNWKRIFFKTLVVVAIISGILVVITKSSPPQETSTEEGIAKIEELESQDVTLAQKYIKSIREQWTQDEAKQIADEAGTLKQSYQDTCTLVMGDSLARGLLEYSVLDENVVISSKGASVGDASAALNSALALSPWHFVMAYGLDDVVSYDGDETAFIAAYREVAGTFKAMRPNAVVYICEITPVSDDAMEEKDVYKNIKVFNEAIRRLCKKEGYIYLETANLVSDYDGGGVVPNYSFFTKWAETILEKVNENNSDDIVKQ